MEQIEERLPGIEEYICKILSKEKLSKYAEQRRLYYAECIEVQKLPNAKPPCLPPRNDSFSAPIRPCTKISTSSSSSSSSYYEVRVPTPSPKAQNKLHMPGVRKTCEPTYQEYDDIKDENENDESAAPLSPSENFYEIPICQDDQKDGTEPVAKYETFVDQDLFDQGDDSDTSYETVDGEVDDTKIKVKTKKNKAKRISIESQDSASGIKSLHNVSISGELHCKLKSKWCKLRWCGVSGNRLIGYQKDKDVRPVLDLALNGYDMTYLDRDGRRSHVIRISCPGSETYFVSFESKERSELWLQHLAAASIVDQDTRNLTLTSDSGVSCDAKSPGCSSSESGHSGDGVAKPISAQPTNSPNLRDDAARNRKGIGAHLTEFLGTFGKKRGKKTMKMAVDISDLSGASDTDVDVSGYLNVIICDRDKDWSRRWCQIRDSYLEVYPTDTQTEAIQCEWSLLLIGCDVVPAQEKADTSLTFKLADTKDRIICEASSVLEQGDWLRVLIRETRCAEPSTESMEYCYIEEEVEHSYQHRKKSSDSGAGQDYDAVEYDDVYMTSPFLDSEKSLSLEVEEFLSEAQKRLSLNSENKNHVGRNDKSARTTNNDSKDRSPKTQSLITVSRSESYSPTSRGSCGVPRAPVRNRVIPRTPIVPRTEKHSRSESSSPVLQRANSTHSAPLTGNSTLSPKRNTSDSAPSSEATQFSPSKVTFARATARSSSADDVPSNSEKRINGTSAQAMEPEDERPQLPGVVPCSQGRTIDQDRELLQSICTDNPFLSQLRNKKISPHEKVRQEITRLKKSLDQLKNHRAAVRRQRAGADSFIEQRRLDAEYRQVDLEYKQIDAEIANLEKQLLTSPISIVTSMTHQGDGGDPTGGDGSVSPRTGRNSVLERMKQFEAMSR